MAFAIVIQKFAIECCVNIVAMKDLTIDEQRDKAIQIQSFFLSTEMAVILVLLTAEFRIRQGDQTVDDLSDSMTFETKDMETPEREAKLKGLKQHNN